MENKNGTNIVCPFCSNINSSIDVLQQAPPRKKARFNLDTIIIVSDDEQPVSSRETPIMYNDDNFFCPVCQALRTEHNSGITLQSCFHTICLDCIKGHVQKTNSLKCFCPVEEYGMRCEGVLEENEVKYLLGRDALEKITNSNSKICRKCEVNHGNSTCEEFRQANLVELYNLYNEELIANIEAFECPICIVEYGPGEGIILRDCMHSFCRDCLAQHVQHSDDLEICCPFMNEEYSCQSALQEREIKALVSPEVYEKRSERIMQKVETQMQNTFHCLKLNCNGWCCIEGDVLIFTCPVCNSKNCIACKVIHDNENCDQYQIRIRAINDDLNGCKEKIEKMIKDGQAMKCPKCQVLLMKDQGCSFVRCTMCKLVLNYSGSLQNLTKYFL